ncbi:MULTISPECIES: inorganic phosphate transporter [unclassified Bradyrhizobium]|jgi:inorganic phosphate transporter, PiT family|uniref:inorganic phosphate transporter n=1 Tax=unclassified Bradyrhizobium TaxID=2631580 RepID=UPI0023B12CA0|nr:inorganic phosphate transporter [Bradyrhizobium sp. CSS354]MDE5462258.1 inorganic phosphate transporter [Bradyrhizobium sp. CSS354]
MSDLALNDARPVAQAAAKPDLHKKPHVSMVAVFLLFLVSGIGYAAYGIFTDTQSVGEPLAISALLLLGVALMIALGFEFVNGFHDTANAVATVIYTHSLPPLTAVIWSGVFNFLGVLVSTGAVAYSVITLLPVDLILQVGSTAGYAMIFALLIAAIIWNLATWSMGIPNSSSHCLIGSIMGVGLTNELLAPTGQATSGVDWTQAMSVGKALLFSPVVGFALSALLLLLLKAVVPVPKLYQEPKGKTPWWIRGILILTCTGVSFAHGGNDGQKGMGLIMLILIGVAPTAYALNRTMPDSSTPAFVDITSKAKSVFAARAQGAQQVSPNDARGLIGTALKTRDLNRPDVFAALASLSDEVANGVKSYGSISRVPAAATPNMRNDMYLAADAIRLLPDAGAKLEPGDAAVLKSYRTSLEDGTRFIPTWVKVSVAIALGLGTMVGWRRIVVTVGERIGKQHLTYAQGASAELVAAGTILGAEFYGMPVSTTHILSSGVAGTMAANGSGLQTGTIRNIVLAWVLTLPAAMLIAGLLYMIFHAVI